ncbi:single-stranded DNA-binding protein [Clostridium luticellarii]|uniref:Single-stranded DNA-binding protein n=1 Tax=Clostridium luticellarii TaxID=1691940 RepID=A0A2T0BRX4_9CLOT|nr:single-stranded DNA-binding protein [Clostridium luticellarii]MCI1943664.1 single-stranded DNA-binding protein [Clostridium luticellarii]MCI1968915.1 single-stranded DNA-binding protein [Clostridium luticellarii]MCI1994292.1 single-stranded DNA-binding protein [Clostridium luticellarii]MCI2038755.1 single-stranded DNA-binding protein [Clostridium luticellarii]PRR86630.1 Single-stranded DNA-binding protein ssb [Clostridium luticellarii]
MLNSVTLIGRLTKDAEIIKMENNVRGVIKFILAVNKDFLNSSGEREADFILVSYWTNRGDNLCPYLKKGRLLGVNGKVSTKSYVKDGVKKFSTIVEADKIQFLEYKEKDLA